MSPGEDGLIGIPFPEHSSELLFRLNAQRRAGLLCDLTLTSRGTRYPTHRSVMAAVSLYFRRLFWAEEGGGGGQGAEVGGGGGGGGGFSVCQLDCVAPDALDALLEFAYTATLTIRSSGMRDVLRGAQLLGIQCVADACRDILGETVEAAVVEERAYHVERERGAERAAQNRSRRKKDRRAVARVGPEQHQPMSYHTDLNTHHSAYPHPSPGHDHSRSLPSTQPPSPEPLKKVKMEPLTKVKVEPPTKVGQNGEQRGGGEPETGATVNGGHWPQEHLRIPKDEHLLVPKDEHHLVPKDEHLLIPKDEHLSEEEAMEGVGNGGVSLGASSTPASIADRGAAGVGRKRKSQTPQQCPVCQKIIHGAGKLPRHMRTHTGEKPFQCSACGVRFTRNDKLKIHMRKHTGERPYPCPHCLARFLHSYDLKNHLSLHSGARPFECPLCHKAFAREDHLQRHRKGHSCLELRTRRPRRPTGHGEDGREGGGDGREHMPDHLDPREPLISPHSSTFLPHGAVGVGDGPRSGASLLLPGEAEMERSLALQALALLGSLPPGMPWRGLELRGVRGLVEGEEAEGTRSPAAHHERWEDKDEDEMGEEEEGEEEEEEEESFIGPSSDGPPSQPGLQ